MRAKAALSLSRRAATVTVRTSSAACPEQVHDTLTDARSHLRWAGDLKLSPFRLTTLTPPDERLTVGATWVSTGKIPLHRHRWHDISKVTVDDRPHRFEYETSATIPRRREGQAERAGTYRHRYVVEPEGAGGSRIIYTITEERFDHHLLRFAIPGVRTTMWALGVRFMARRGLRNLAAVSATAAARSR